MALEISGAKITRVFAMPPLLGESTGSMSIWVVLCALRSQFWVSRVSAHFSLITYTYPLATANILYAMAGTLDIYTDTSGSCTVLECWSLQRYSGSGRPAVHPVGLPSCNVNTELQTQPFKHVSAATVLTLRLEYRVVCSNLTACGSGGGLVS